MTRHGLSILILNYNAITTIEMALKSATFADEVLVLDDGSTDGSLARCQDYAVLVLKTQKVINFAQKRNILLKAATYDWVFYLDSDEMITAALRREIEIEIAKQNPGAYRMTRRNFFLGKEMYPDQVERLFHKTTLNQWQGDVHEHPVYANDVIVKTLQAPLLHYTHRTINSMLYKTNQWSEIEADLRLRANHPIMSWWRLVRIGLTTFIGEYLSKKLYRFGREGLFEAYFQMIDKLIVYTKLWERQHNA